MYNVTIPDNHPGKTIHANPKGTSGLQPVPSQNTTYNKGASDPTSILGITTPGGQPNPSTDPFFVVTPAFRFFGADRVINVTITGAVVGGGGATKSTLMTVTVQGTLPDDGTLDHFDSLADATP